MERRKGAGQGCDPGGPPLSSTLTQWAAARTCCSGRGRGLFGLSPGCGEGESPPGPSALQAGDFPGRRLLLPRHTWEAEAAWPRPEGTSLGQPSRLGAARDKGSPICLRAVSPWPGEGLPGPRLHLPHGIRGSLSGGPTCLSYLPWAQPWVLMGPLSWQATSGTSSTSPTAW